MEHTINTMLTKEQRDELISKNIGLAYKVATEFTNRGVDYEDLVGAGEEGLVKAVDKFNPDAGVKFSSFAYPVIKGAIQDYIQKEGRNIYLPDSFMKDYSKVNKAKTTFVQEYGYEPEYDELADFMDDDAFDADKISEIYYYSRNTISYDKVIGNEDDDDGCTLLDLISDNYCYDYDDEKPDYSAFLEEVESCLTDKEREILHLVKTTDLHLSDIALDYDTSRQNILVIANRAISKMRDYIKSHNMRDPRA